MFLVNGQTYLVERPEEAEPFCSSLSAQDGSVRLERISETGGFFNSQWEFLSRRGSTGIEEKQK
ncbi:hypothetical protein ABLT31_04910 [Ammoniphilus sp. 3BR4]